MPANRFSEAAAAPNSLEQRPARFLPKKEVLRRVGCSYTTVWELMKRGEFPRSRQLGRRAVWIEQEIEEFITSRPVRRLKGDEGDRHS